MAKVVGLNMVATEPGDEAFKAGMNPTKYPDKAKMVVDKRQPRAIMEECVSWR